MHTQEMTDRACDVMAKTQQLAHDAVLGVFCHRCLVCVVYGICCKLHVSVALQGLMPNYVKVVPSIAIAFVSYEQVNVSSPGLHCDCSAACHQHQTDCHVPTSLTPMSPAFESTQNSLGR